MKIVSIEMPDDLRSKFKNKKLMAVSSELTITDAAKVMDDSKVDSVLVFENESVIGVVTNKDVLGVITKGVDPSKITIKEITHKP